jgi:hypothetical protein
MRVHTLRIDRRGEIRFVIDAFKRGDQFIARISATRIHAGSVPRPMNHTFPECAGATEREAVKHAEEHIDNWVNVMGAEEDV